jgi:hypothetical protein
MFESAKKKLKKIIWASSARNGSFGVFFEKKGVKLVPLSWRPIHVGAWYMFAPVRPSRSSSPSCCRPQGPRSTFGMRHCVRTRLLDDVVVQVAANVDKVSQIYHGGQSTPV